MSSIEPLQRKRKSRFEERATLTEQGAPTVLDSALPDAKRTSIDIAAAAARAAAISRELSNKIATNPQTSQAARAQPYHHSVVTGSIAGLEMNAAFSFGNGLVPDTQQGNRDKASSAKAAYIPLLLDAQGREIDEFGNLVQRQGPQGAAAVRTLAANKAVDRSLQKKNNPYLAHRQIDPHQRQRQGKKQHQQDAAAGTAEEEANEVVQELDGAHGRQQQQLDERLKQTRRDIRGKKSLRFVQPGELARQADEAAAKEERKVIAGYASGRKALEATAVAPATAGVGSVEGADPDGAEEMQIAVSSEWVSVAVISVPPAAYAEGPAVLMEWWDEAFLPKERREAVRTARNTPASLLLPQSTTVPSSSGAGGERAGGGGTVSAPDWGLLSLQCSRTHKLVQHPVPVRPLHGTGREAPTGPLVLPMYLTKREQKKLRRATRRERELEKRDKLMMGLIPAPEPKFKLSNFMKVLGEQAVADPSMVELRVLEQMQQRVLNHHMRNQAAKLTPQERKQKTLRRLQEDTAATGVHVAVFRVRDFSSLKHRFKVDVNAQQHFLTGIVLLCPSERKNLVVVEGGPRGVRKLVRLMTERIPWEAVDGSGDVGAGVGDEEEARSDYDDDDDDDEDDREEEVGEQGGGRGTSEVDGRVKDGCTGAVGGTSGGGGQSNRCDLLWRGIVAKRAFSGGFRFQESSSVGAARQLLRARGVAVEHYWDMLESADAAIASAETTTSALF